MASGAAPVLTWVHLSRADAREFLRLHAECNAAGLRETIEQRIDLCGLSRVALPQEPRYRTVREYTREEIARICGRMDLADPRLVLRKQVDGQTFVDAPEDDLMALLQIRPTQRSTLSAIRADRALCDRLTNDGSDGSFSRQRIDVLLDLFVGVVQYASSAGFQEERLSALWSILWSVHTAGMTGRLAQNEAYGLLLNVVATHAAQVPPFATQLFSRQQARGIVEHLHEVYIEAYDMYLHGYTAVPTCKVETKFPAEVTPAPWGMPCPPVPRPLQQAMNEEQWDEHCEQHAVVKAEAEAEGAARAKADKDAACEERLQDLKQQLTDTVGRPVSDLEARLARLEKTVPSAEGQAS